MKIIECKSNKNILIDGLFEIVPEIYKDSRGYFFESYNEEKFYSLGLKMKFVQDNKSFSKKNVLRGMHFQKKFPQGKLITCLSGKIFDVVIDIRKDSKTFGQFSYVILDSEKHNMFYIPEGFAHGFYVLSKTAEIEYKCSDYYHPEDENGIIWNDKELNICWPRTCKNPILSEKDKNYSSIEKIFNLYKENNETL